MKKIVSLLLIFTMVITLSACGKKDNNPAKEPTPTQQTDIKDKDKDKDNDNETKDPLEKTPDVGENNPKEGEEPEEGKEKEPEMTEEEKEKAKSYEEQIKSLIKNSHYISIIKMTQTGAAGKEIHVIEDFKGSLKNIEFPEIKNLEANRDYLIFFRDSDTGDLIPTDAEKGIVELQGDDDQALKIVRDTLSPKENPEEQKSDNK